MYSFRMPSEGDVIPTRRRLSPEDDRRLVFLIFIADLRSIALRAFDPCFSQHTLMFLLTRTRNNNKK